MIPNIVQKYVFDRVVGQHLPNWRPLHIRFVDAISMLRNLTVVRVVALVLGYIIIGHYI
jgi:hypothetical protein